MRTGIIIIDTDSKKTQKEANPVSRISHTFRISDPNCKRKAAAGPAGAVDCGDRRRGDYGDLELEFSGLLSAGRWESEEERGNGGSKFFFYLLYIIASYMGNGPSCPRGPGQVPLLPWPRAGPGLTRGRMFLDFLDWLYRRQLLKILPWHACMATTSIFTNAKHTCIWPEDACLFGETN